MNYLIVPTLLLAAVCFVAGIRLGRHGSWGGPGWLLYGIGVIIAMPAALFAVYYLKLLGEAVWFYQFRSLPCSELTAAGAGFLAGLVFERIGSNAGLRRLVRPWFAVVLLVLALIAPYVKPVLLPLRWTAFQERWMDGVCLQTSESSCGPACAATLLRKLGTSATEAALARESFTSRTGTENWYLARTLRRHGARVKFVFQPDSTRPWPVQSIAGVRLSSFGDTGHFIAVLGRSGDNYIIGDPLFGREIKSPAELAKAYRFTGLFMVIE